MIGARERLWARVGLAAQVAFLVSWLVAAAWQRGRYSSAKHTISDMYAVGAPAALFLVIVLTLTGLGTILFAWFSVRPVLHGGGNASTVGAALLALSIFGLGDLLTPAEREGCRLADPGCTGSEQMSNLGGKLDSVISTIGILLFLAALLVLARALHRAGGRWRGWAWPMRWAAIVFFLLLVALLVGQNNDLGGLFERFLAGFGALVIAALAGGIVRETPVRS